MKAEKAVGLANKFVHFIETGEVPAGLFAPDIFCEAQYVFQGLIPAALQTSRAAVKSVIPQ